MLVSHRQKTRPWALCAAGSTAVWTGSQKPGSIVGWQALLHQHQQRMVFRAVQTLYALRHGSLEQCACSLEALGKGGQKVDLTGQASRVAVLRCGKVGKTAKGFFTWTWTYPTLFNSSSIGGCSRSLMKLMRSKNSWVNAREPARLSSALGLGLLPWAE